MPLPPKGDVTRPIYLAARSMLVLGILCLIGSTCGLIGTIGMFAAMPAAPARTGGPPTTGQFIMVIGVVLLVITAIYAAIGVTFIICSVRIKQGKRWAVTTGLVLASIAAAFCGLGLLGNLAGIATGPAAGSDDWIGALISALFVAAFIQLIVHLKQSYAGIEQMAYGSQRGFDVVMPTAQPYNPPQYPPHGR